MHIDPGPSPPHSSDVSAGTNQGGAMCDTCTHAYPEQYAASSQDQE